MLVPLSTFTPEVSIPLWALVHLPVVVTLSTAVFTPNGWVHSILYVLFENAMGIVKLGAVIAGERAVPSNHPCARRRTVIGCHSGRPRVWNPILIACISWMETGLLWSTPPLLPV